MSLTPELFTSALYNFKAQDQDSINQATEFLLAFRSQNPSLFLEWNINFLAQTSNPPSLRSLSAIFLFGIIHQETAELQKRYNSDWITKVPPQLREQLCAGATEGLLSQDESLRQQSSSLLGLFFSMEWSVEDSPIMSRMRDIFSNLSSDPPLPIRISINKMFVQFVQSVHYVIPNCGCDQKLYRDLAEPIFGILITSMANSSFPQVQLETAKTFSNTLVFFERVFSFGRFQEQLIQGTVSFISSSNEDFAYWGFILARQIVDDLYPHISPPAVQLLLESARTNLTASTQGRVTGACQLLQTFGDVETDLNNIERDPISIKPRHRDFGGSNHYSEQALQSSLDLLIQLIVRIISDP